MRDLFVGVMPFVYAAQERSFRRAAERLGITPAAVSKAVQRLETELGVQLLNRTTRRVELSPEGELYLARCQEAIAQVQAGRQRLEMARRDPRGELTVSLPPILGQLVVSRIVRFTGRYPHLEVHLRFTDRVSRMIDEGIDVALRMGVLADSTLAARRLMQTRWATVAAPGYLARRGTPHKLDALNEHDCVVFRGPRGAAVPWSFAAGEGIERKRVTPRLVMDQGDLLLEAAIAGVGICQVLDFMIGDAVRAGRVVEILRDVAAPGPDIHAVFLSGQRTSPRIRAFLDFLVDELALPGERVE
ncbi:MAG: LysR family transcriptional regulator [Haliangiales bacterium]